MSSITEETIETVKNLSGKYDAGFETDIEMELMMLKGQMGAPSSSSGDQPKLIVSDKDNQDPVLLETKNVEAIEAQDVRELKTND